MADVADLDLMTLEQFKMWTPLALKTFLSVRKKATDGTYDELAARAFITWEENIQVDHNKEEQLRRCLEEYASKLQIRDNVLPDPFTLKEGWVGEEGKTLWPSIYFQDIAEYLRMKTPTELYKRLCSEYKQGKAYRYFTSGQVKEVYYHTVNAGSDICFLSAEVCPSMKVSMKPYQVWVAVQKDNTNCPGGYIESGYCTCTAGLQGSCNHIAGLLFRVEAAVRAGLTDPSCTSKLCTWDVPAKNIVPQQPVVLARQEWSKDHYLNQDKGEFHASVQKLASEFTPMSKSQQLYATSANFTKDLADILDDILPSSCFVQMNKSKPFPRNVKPKLPPSVIEVSTGEECRDVEGLIQALEIGQEEIDLLCTETVLQAESENWIIQRKGRVTASNFGRIAKKVASYEKDKDVNMNRLVHEIIGIIHVPQTKAMKHGKAMEPHAKKLYRRKARTQHQKFFTKETGLTVLQEFPYIGASPDLLVECECHGKGICEIKCPFKIKHESPSCANLAYIIKGENGEEMLSRNSDYFYQVQGQMAILNVSYCDFFVYTAHGYYLQRIHFESQFWDSLLQKLNTFWKNFVAPELLTFQTDDIVYVDKHEGMKELHNYSMIQPERHSDHPYARPREQSTPKNAGPLTHSKYQALYLCCICGKSVEAHAQSSENDKIQPICENCSSIV